MREALMTDLDPPITYSKAITKYTTTPSSVTAHFADGSSAEGSLLIGADGLRSRVAAQLTGGRVEVIDLARMIFGRTPITRDIELALHPSLRNGMALVVDPKDPHGQLNLFVEAMRFTHQGANPDYLHWVLTGIPPHFGVDDTTLLASDGSSARHFSLKATSAWDQTIRALLEHQDPRHTSVLRLTSSSPRGVVKWQTDRRVTLLGDAVHSMSPTGGSGANTALWDAQTLAHILASGVAEDGWTTDAIGEYETRMREFAGKQVTMSYQAASHGFGVKLPD
jgi:2-polyprenyl-6-methoxyphenol hydroxylase-like FAD-dependent oxidoreductase